MKEFRSLRFLIKKKSEHRKAGRISLHLYFFRKWMVLNVLVLLITVSAQSSFANRTERRQTMPLP